MRRKLLAIVVLVSGAGFAVVTVGLLANNRHSFERSLLNDMTIMAEVIARNSEAALAFEDDREAADILAALSADPNIEAGALYTADGELFAGYRRAGAEASLPRQVVGGEYRGFDEHGATVLQAIRRSDELSGWVLVQANTGEWTQILRSFLFVLGGLFALTMLLVIVLALYLTRLVIAPIVHLAGVARAVSAQRNYGLRARKYTNDEIGELAEVFNAMLWQIQQQHEQLTQTQHRLRERVRELNDEMRERRAVEFALRESEGRYRALFENSPLPMWVHEMDSQKLIAVNDAAVDHYGYTREEFLALTATDIQVGEGRAVIGGESEPNAMLRQHTEVQRHRRKDGSVIDVEAVSHVIRFSGMPSAIVLANDITDRLNAEQALQRYSERLAVLNRLDRIVSSSFDIAEFYEAFVQGLGQLLRFDRTSILVMDDAREHVVLVAQWTDGRPNIHIGTRIPLSNSVIGVLTRTRRPILERELGEAGDWPESAGLRSENIRSRVLLPLIAKGDVIGVLTVASRRPGNYGPDDLDVLLPLADQLAMALHNAKLYAQTQQISNELERRVAERTAQLQNANRELEAFSYSVSHDLRAPLRALDGFSAALMASYSDRLDSQALDYLQRIRAASQRMGFLIDDLLKLARVTRGDLIRTDVDVSRLALAVLDALRAQQPARKVEAVIAPGLTAHGDANLLAIAFDNLLGNAWKFTRDRAPARIEVGTEMIDGESVLYVRDNGVGFDMAYAGKLFGAFQRLHTAKEFDGTGVGLATVQRIVHRHGGRIWANAAPDNGAVFRFTLG